MRLLLFCVVTCFCVSMSYANSFASWWQIKAWRPVLAVGGGLSIPSDSGQSQNFPIKNPITDEFYKYSAKNSAQTSGLFDTFIGIERDLCSKWLLQAGLDYQFASSFSTKGTFIQGADIASENTYSYRYQVITRQFLFATKWLYTYKEWLHPYIFAGLGPSFNKAYSYNTNVPPDLTFTRKYASNTTAGFSYALGFGLDADIYCHVRLGIGYRFADLGKVQLGSARIDDTHVSGTLSQSNFYTNELLAQLTYVF